MAWLTKILQTSLMKSIYTLKESILQLFVLNAQVIPGPGGRVGG